MAVTLEPCVARILRTLSVATLRAICAAVAMQKSFADFRITKLLFQKAKIEIQSVRLAVIQELYDAALAPIDEALAFYPTGVAQLVNTCPQFGSFLEAPQEILGTLTATADNLLYKAREYTSFIDSINDEIDTLTNTIELLDAVCALAETIIVEQLTPEAV